MIAYRDGVAACRLRIEVRRRALAKRHDQLRARLLPRRLRHELHALSKKLSRPPTSPEDLRQADEALQAYDDGISAAETMSEVARASGRLGSLWVVATVATVLSLGALGLANANMGHARRLSPTWRLESQPCRKSAACSRRGQCTLSGNSCVATSDADCGTSEVCMYNSWCHARDGRCVSMSSLFAPPGKVPRPTMWCGTR